WVLVPQRNGLRADGVGRSQRVAIIEGAGEGDDADAGSHEGGAPAEQSKGGRRARRAGGSTEDTRRPVPRVQTPTRAKVSDFCSLTTVPLPSPTAKSSRSTSARMSCTPRPFSASGSTRVPGVAGGGSLKLTPSSQISITHWSSSTPATTTYSS